MTTTTGRSTPGLNMRDATELQPGAASAAPLATGEHAQFKTQRDCTLHLNGERGRPFVRVFYRKPGTRAWRKRIVFPGDGATLETIEERAQEIADRLLAGEVA